MVFRPATNTAAKDIKMLEMDSRTPNTLSSSSLYLSNYMSEQTYSEVDALLQEFQNLSLGETDAFFANTELGTTFVNDQLGEIFIAFLSQFFTPDITTYRSTCDSLMPLISLALLTAKSRQLVCFVSSHFDALAYRIYSF